MRARCRWISGRRLFSGWFGNSFRRFRTAPRNPIVRLPRALGVLGPREQWRVRALQIRWLLRFRVIEWFVKTGNWADIVGGYSASKSFWRSKRRGSQHSAILEK